MWTLWLGVLSVVGAVVMAVYRVWSPYTGKAPIGPAIGCLPPLARVLPLLLRLRHLPLPLGWGRGKKVCGGGGGGGGASSPPKEGGGSRKGARRSGPFMKQNFGYFLPSELKKIPDLTPARPYGV